MKKLLLLFIAVFVITACQPKILEVEKVVEKTDENGVTTVSSEIETTPEEKEYKIVETVKTIKTIKDGKVIKKNVIERTKIELD